MRRLNILAEGDTEETFVNEVLALHLAEHGVAAVVRRVTTRRERRRPDVVHRGGLLDYRKAQRDLHRWMAEDPTAAFTTMYDLYALPGDFPGYAAAEKLVDPYARVQALEGALAADVGDWRFIPYIQLHEFEALLLSEPEKLDWEYVNHAVAIDRLTALTRRFESPELINDGPLTAPSKRIIAEIPEYKFQKASVGPEVAKRIGLAKIRERCPHFSEWVKRLEELGAGVRP